MGTYLIVKIKWSGRLAPKVIKGNGEFDKPARLALDADNNFYVVCGYNHRVQKLTVHGGISIPVW